MMLECNNLQSYRGDLELFKDLNFSLDRGQLLHLKGHNGSGKTTLIRILCQLITATKGDILWQQESIKNNHQYQQNLLYIGHQNALNVDLTALENLIFSCCLNQQPISQSEAIDALKIMGLVGHEDLPVRVLSQGQQRRVALSRLLVSQQTLWILDEPFTALDYVAVEQLEQLIQQHLQNAGLVILTTHQELQLKNIAINILELGWKN